MTVVLGVLTLLFALLISGTAAYFSIAGLAVLFAGVFWPVVAMGAALEGGKLVAAAWLHANWSNARVGVAHKLYLSTAIGILMVVTALGIYGYLSKGHIEQAAPLATVQLQIAQIETRIQIHRDEVKRLTERTAALDAVIASFLRNDRPSQSVNVQNAQKAERKRIADDLARAQADIVSLTTEAEPLRATANDVGAKLGPVRYVADLFGWTEPESAVRLVIVLLILAFDPLAVALVIAATITFSDVARQRHEKRRATEPETTMEPPAAPVLPVGTIVLREEPAPDDHITVPVVVSPPSPLPPPPPPAPPPVDGDGIPANPVETMMRTWDAPGPMSDQTPDEFLLTPETVAPVAAVDMGPQRDDTSWLDPAIFKGHK